MYRSIPHASFSDQLIYRHTTPRLPSNVPYLIDNIWEYFRPEDKPSRRYAVYASPTPRLALENATADYLKKDQYLVCEVISEEPLKTMQLCVSDARYHPDIRKIQKIVHEALYLDRSLEYKKAMALLFAPAVEKHELISNLYLSCFIDKLKNYVTIWQDIAVPEGEMFFETMSYRLFPLPTQE